MVSLLLLALAQAPLVSQTTCAGFDVVFTSPSGELTEDDQRVEVVVEGARFAVPFAPAMFTGSSLWPLGPLPKSVRCRDGLVAWEVKPGLLVLMLTRSGRPGLDLLSLALVDLKARKTLQVVETQHLLASGRLENPRRFSFVVREAKDGFDVRAVREWLPGDDSIEAALEDWLAVRVRGTKLTATWLRP